MNTLSNKHLTIKSKASGAELTSIVNNKTGAEYLWQADPKFWGRHSPVLFPIVGSLYQSKYKHKGLEYAMSQHGFARDMDFEQIRSDKTAVFYKFVSNEETLARYPFTFELIVGYKLINNKIEVIWEVNNKGSNKMHFQIGAHPAFNYPNFEEGAPRNGYFAFNKKENITYKTVGQGGGMAMQPTYTIAMDGGLMPLNIDSFDGDALIIEDSQINKVALLDINKNPYLTLHFTAPVVGLWAPPKKNAPFVCIEPWYGRCDRENYDGEFENKDWINHLEVGETFKSSYVIEIEI